MGFNAVFTITTNYISLVCLHSHIMSNGFCTTISKLIMNHAVSRHIQPCPIISSPIQSQLHHYVRTGLYFSACLIAIFCKTFKTVSNLLPKTLLKRVGCEVSPLVERCLLEAAEVNMVKLMSNCLFSSSTVVHFILRVFVHIQCISWIVCWD